MPGVLIRAGLAAGLFEVTRQLFPALLEFGPLGIERLALLQRPVARGLRLAHLGRLALDLLAQLLRLFREAIAPLTDLLEAHPPPLEPGTEVGLLAVGLVQRLLGLLALLLEFGHAGAQALDLGL
ncbi:MAG TPA: hypothetical protein VLD39_05995, partial [Gammaproteobacteria bacterium]|nr:hypothetical protein [Gammaproteobacteria bacterium]